MKSKLNDAGLLAEAYSLINKPTIVEEGIPAIAARAAIGSMMADEEHVDCPGCSDCMGDEAEPMAIAVEMPEPAEDNHPDDSEINMAMSELYKIEKYANELSHLLQGMPALEGWTASKITKAADYLGSVFHKLDYDVNGHSMHNTGYEDAMEDGE